MSVWDWLLRLLGVGSGASGREVAQIQKQVFLLKAESITIARDLTRINEDRSRFTDRLVKADTQEEARLWSQRLQGLDIEEQGCKPRWDQVERELRDYQTALTRLKNIPKVNLGRVEEQLRGLAAVIEERSRQQVALMEM